MSDNIYQDMGHPDAEVMNAKADLVVRLHLTIQERGLTRRRAAKVLSMSQYKLARILRGDFHDVPMATLVDCLNRLGHDVDIIVRPAVDASQPGRMKITAA